MKADRNKNIFETGNYSLLRRAPWLQALLLLVSMMGCYMERSLPPMRRAGWGATRPWDPTLMAHGWRDASGWTRWRQALIQLVTTTMWTWTDDSKVSSKWSLFIAPLPIILILARFFSKINIVRSMLSSLYKSMFTNKSYGIQIDRIYPRIYIKL